MNAQATSFATRQDLARFAAYVTAGHSPQAALSVGDNGIGSFGDATWRPDGPPMCALPHGLGHRGMKVHVTLSLPETKPFDCICADTSPAGVIDLNPAALLAAGLSADHELNDPHATWTAI